MRVFAAYPEVEGRSHLPRSHGTARHQRDPVALTRDPGHHWRMYVPCHGVMLRLRIYILYIAGFDFHFGSLDNKKTELASQYENLL